MEEGDVEQHLAAFRPCVGRRRRRRPGRSGRGERRLPGDLSAPFGATEARREDAGLRDLPPGNKIPVCHGVTHADPRRRRASCATASPSARRSSVWGSRRRWPEHGRAGLHDSVGRSPLRLVRRAGAGARRDRHRLARRLVVAPRSAVPLVRPPEEDVARWAVGLVAAVVIVAVSRRCGGAARRAVDRGGRSRGFADVTAGIQRLASALSAAVTPPTWRALWSAHARAARRRGGALGLVDGSELVIVDPLGTVEQTLTPGFASRSTRAPITMAAREGQPVIAADRAASGGTFRTARSLRRTPTGRSRYRSGRQQSRGLDGVSLRRPDVGDREHARRGADRRRPRRAGARAGRALRRRALAETCARRDPAGCATDRRDTLEEAEEAVCEEAQATLGADIVQVWRLAEPALRGECRRPANPSMPRGTAVALGDYPGLAEALALVQPSFIADVQAVVSGDALERARHNRVRSSFRIPIVVGGEISRVLVLQWHTVISAPGPSQSLLARRFADQAGLALEQTERRAAERAAALAAEQTKRLLDVSSALASAADLPDVATASSRSGCRSLDAQAGVVVLQHHRDDALETVDIEPSGGWRIPILRRLHCSRMRCRTGSCSRSSRPPVDVAGGARSGRRPLPVLAGDPARRRRQGGRRPRARLRRATAVRWRRSRFCAGARAAGRRRHRACAAVRVRAHHRRDAAAERPAGVAPVVDGVQMAARYLPGTAAVDVGGDWFDAIPLGDGRLGLAVGDVVGKGVRAAATMAQLRNGLRAFALDQMKPSSTVSRLNRLTGEVDDSAFATLIYAVLDPAPSRRSLHGGRSPSAARRLPRPTGRVRRGWPQPAAGGERRGRVRPGHGRAPHRGDVALLHRRAGGASRPPAGRGPRGAAAGGGRGPGRSRTARRPRARAPGRGGVRGDDVAILAVRLLAAAPAPLDLRLPASPRSLDLARDALRSGSTTLR